MCTAFSDLPVALTIAGSDCSAGAGIQADLKTFRACGVYGLTAVTCVVAEVPGRVVAVQALEPVIVRQQIELCLAAFPVAAIKTGMLYSQEIIERVAEAYAGLPAAARPPLVVDPVMLATSGDSLLRGGGAVTAYQERLFPLAALVTPNLDEARALLGGPPLTSADAMREAGRALCARYGVAFLMKGGHLGGDTALDVLSTPDGGSVDFTAGFTRGFSTHGTGCTYSAAITAGLATGLPLAQAVAQGKSYVTGTIAHGLRWTRHGRRTDALRH